MLEKYKEYAELTAQIKVLEEQKKEINKIIFKDLEEREANQLKSDFGTFSFVERKTYKYTVEVSTQTKILKQLKADEEENGKAEMKASKSLRFQSVK